MLTCISLASSFFPLVNGDGQVIHILEESIVAALVDY